MLGHNDVECFMLNQNDVTCGILGLFGGVCLIMIMILRNTPPTGMQWVAIMFVSGGGGYFSYLTMESYGANQEWEMPVAFAVGFCTTHLGKYALMILEDPKKLLAILNWLRGKNEPK
jgi:hypothetical protein